MNFIPQVLLKKLYTLGSLRKEPNGFSFAIKNRLAPARIIQICDILLDGTAIPLNDMSTGIGQDTILTADQISFASPLEFPLGQSIRVYVPGKLAMKEKYQLSFHIKTQPFGTLKFSAEDILYTGSASEKNSGIPREEHDDYSEQAIHRRQGFISERTGLSFKHIQHYSFDPKTVQNNCENFTGVAQIPLGLAGPLIIRGEYAQGDFLIPLATTEGSLVASFNRGMKLINACGGVRCTVVNDGMQRAPMFVMTGAREARDFNHWVQQHLTDIREIAEQSSSVARLKEIECYQLSKVAFLRFVFTTGDAAGQNIVSKAVFEACQWILKHYTGNIEHFYMESNLAADKKHAHINMLRGRGKTVVAEIALKQDLVYRHLGATVEQIHHLGSLANLGAFLGGASNNGLQSANALAALFIALGQDVANVAECSAGAMHSEITPAGDLYGSITLPSLIVATYGGGTGLATQRECLEMLDCYGAGKVNKLAEIVAGVVAAGEISLAGAIASLDWVAGHEKYGRNKNDEHYPTPEG